MRLRIRRSLVLGCLAAGFLVYAVTITTLNLRHNRAMPDETRVALSSLENLSAASLPVQIIETPLVEPRRDGALERRDVHVEYAGRSFPPSRAVWVNTALPRIDPGRYLHRFRAGYLRFDADGPSREALFLIEVHQNFAEHGDEPRANLWLFPPEAPGDGSATTDAVRPARFAHAMRLSDARQDPQWRALFADAHARPVRAFPALAALLISMAASGSLLLGLWRDQPWAVIATTVTFVLPIVSAAPFLTAFGWAPIVAAVVLGFVVTTAMVCAVDQRLAPHLRASLRTGVARRLADAFLVPVVALLAGTALTVSFASVSVIPLQGLGSATPGEIFRQSLIVPAAGLLLGGTGTCLLLAVFHLILNWRNRSVGSDAVTEG